MSKMGELWVGWCSGATKVASLGIGTSLSGMVGQRAQNVDTDLSEVREDMRRQCPIAVLSTSDEGTSSSAHRGSYAAHAPVLTLSYTIRTSAPPPPPRKI